jgi:hypothetical protein
MTHALEQSHASACAGIYKKARALTLAFFYPLRIHVFLDSLPIHQRQEDLHGCPFVHGAVSEASLMIVPSRVIMPKRTMS